ncbi:MAG: flagellin [Cereibacter changlensis]|uniref:Flagellin n=3 Tax=Cereibacter changlensis TaxID=402884 RepID=A0A2T4JYG5_9RHOB|nr:flagellin [Cereibacter changlensis]PTE22960.1 flagellin [Cereibacter changlensis JA139]PZX58846.1 flagellin [Cereibacter changlensis]
MSSILTNTGAMVALQTLKGINTNLAKTQDQISTGKSVNAAKDNAAVWAISKVMESDVTGFKAISDSLALGKSTVSLSSKAAESVASLLTEMKGKIVAAQEASADKTKIQTDIAALTKQIDSVVSAAQFNGLSLLSNRDSATTYALIKTTVTGTGSVNVLSSLDRSATGVASASIAVAKQDLGTQAAAAGGLTLAAAAFTAAGTATANGAALATYTVAGETATAGRNAAVMAGDGYSFDLTKFVGTNATATGTALYVARDGDTTTDIAKNLADTINFELKKQGLSTDFTITASGATFTVQNNTATALAAAAAGDATLTAGGKAGGGLALVAKIDVSTTNGAKAALSAIEGLIQTSIKASSSFGSAEGRIMIQTKFVGDLMDSMKAGIGSMVDADMEEASARLQALQVQQQLGIQALSIANQAPQNILSLFR